MYHPFQNIACSKQGNESILLVAAGPSLTSVNLAGGTVSGRWRSNALAAANGVEDPADQEISSERASKRRKVEQSKTEANIIKIVPTMHGHHVVVVTGEDKCIRVFALTKDGAIRLVNERYMYKRPSAITLIDNDSIIICADKFGDVYALPLLPTEEQENAAKEAARRNTRSLRVMATETTVHSKANLKTLEFQRKQAQEDVAMKTKENLEFTHDYLLGHVSMITDVIAVNLPVTPASTALKTHILTSDRDEHIRVSRGPPQAFVIERFLLGHKEYISKLCLVSPALLVSGGGDHDLLVWNVLDGTIVSRVPLLSALIHASGKSEQDVNINVSGLWLLPVSPQHESIILIALEGQPYLFHLPVSSLTATPNVKTIKLQGNLLDLTIADDVVIVSLDNVHEPGSTKNVSQGETKMNRLHLVDIAQPGLSVPPPLQQKLVEANEIMNAEWHEKQLQTLLYSTASLRKLRDDREEKVDDDAPS